MALVPRSSLRSLVLLLSHTKPWLSSFSSSSAANPPPGNCTPAAPALPDCSSHERPPREGTAVHPLPDPSPGKGNAVIGESSCSSTLEYPERSVPLPCTADKDPKKPTPDDSGSCSSMPEPEPVPGTGPGRGPPVSKLPGPPVSKLLDPPRRP